MKETFYYLRDQKGRPLVTVCLLENGGFSRGIAVCSPKDNPNKRVGRSIAKQRARWALSNKQNNCDMLRREPHEVIKATGHEPALFCHAKSYFQPPLTMHETELLFGPCAC